MATSVTCPSCKKVLKSNAEIPAGKFVKCPSCQHTFAVPGANGDAEAIRAERSAPVPARKTVARSASVDDDELPAKKKSRFDDEDDDYPRKKKSSQRNGDEDDLDDDDRPRVKKKPRRDDNDDDYDDDDRPVKKKSRRDDDEDDYDDDDRPAKKKSRRDDDDDDDYDDAPRSKKKARADRNGDDYDDEEDDDDDRPRKKKKKKKAGSPVALILGLAGVGVLMIVGVVLLFVWPGWMLSGSGTGGAGAGAGKGGAAKSPLMEALVYAPEGTDVVVVANLSGPGETIFKKLKNSGMIPATNAGEDEVFQDVDTMFVAVNASAKPPTSTMILLMKKDQEADKLKATVKAEKSDTIKEKTVLRVWDATFYLPSPKMIVVFNGMKDDQIGKLIENKENKVRSEILNKLKKHKHSTAYVVAVPSEDTKKMVAPNEMMLKQMGPMADLVRAVHKATIYSGSATLSPDAKTIKIDAAVTCAGAEDAGKSRDLLDKSAKAYAALPDFPFPVFGPKGFGQALLKDIGAATFQASGSELTGTLTLSEESVTGLVMLAEMKGNKEQRDQQKKIPPNQPPIGPGKGFPNKTSKVDPLHYSLPDAEIALGVNFKGAGAGFFNRIRNSIKMQSPLPGDLDMIQDLDSLFVTANPSAVVPMVTAVLTMTRDQDLEKLKTMLKADKVDNVKGLTFYRKQKSIVYIADARTIVVFFGIHDSLAVNLINEHNFQLTNELLSQLGTVRDATVYVVAVQPGILKQQVNSMRDADLKQLGPLADVVKTLRTTTLFRGSATLSPDARTLKLDAAFACANSNDVNKSRKTLEDAAKAYAAAPNFPFGIFGPADGTGKAILRDLSMARFTANNTELSATITLSDETMTGLIKLVESAASKQPPINMPPGTAPPGTLPPGTPPPPDKELRKLAKDNLKQVMGALLFNANRHSDNLTPTAIYDRKTGKPLLSWRVHVLEAWGSDEFIHQKFKVDEPWDSPHNIALLKVMPQMFAPVGVPNAPPGMTCYKAVVGKGVAMQTIPDKNSHIGARSDLRIKQDFFNKKIPSSFPDIKNVIGIVETTELVPWTKPDDWEYSEQRPLPKLGCQFQDGFLVAFMDGRVVVLSKSIDERTLRSLIPRVSVGPRGDYAKFMLK